jgi:hypothetical protein
VTSLRDTVTRSDAVTVTPQQEFRRSDLHERVAEKQADGLRLLILVGACGAFVPMPSAGIDYQQASFPVDRYSGRDWTCVCGTTRKQRRSAKGG